MGHGFHLNHIKVETKVKGSSLYGVKDHLKALLQKDEDVLLPKCKELKLIPLML